MRTLIATIILSLSFTANADELAKSYSCLAEDGNMVRYSTEYGELTVMDKTGKLVMDHDDGYNEKVTFVETNPVTVEISVVHHEEPSKTIMEIYYLDKLQVPYKGFYKSVNGKLISMKCLPN